jgi:hypothetical protein
MKKQPYSIKSAVNLQNLSPCANCAVAVFRQRYVRGVAFPIATVVVVRAKSPEICYTRPSFRHRSKSAVGQRGLKDIRIFARLIALQCNSLYNESWPGKPENKRKEPF